MILPSQVQGDQKDWHVTYRAIKIRYYVQFLLSFRKPNMLVRIDSRFSLYPECEQNQNNEDGGLSVQVRCDQAVGIFWQFTFF